STLEGTTQARAGGTGGTLRGGAGGGGAGGGGTSGVGTGGAAGGAMGTTGGASGGEQAAMAAVRTRGRRVFGRYRACMASSLTTGTRIGRSVFPGVLPARACPPPPRRDVPSSPYRLAPPESP